MAPFKIFLGASIAVTFFLNRYTEFYLPSRSLVVTAFVIFSLETIAWLVWRCLLYPNLFSPLRALPGPSGGPFLMGQSLNLRGDPNGHAELYRAWSEQVPNDGIIRYLDIFNSEILLPVSPKALAEVLVQRPYEFIKPPGLVTGLGRILGVGVFLAEGEEHKKQRKDLMPAFAFRHIKELYPIFWAKSSELVQALISHSETGYPESEKPGTSIDIKDWASRATLDIIGLAGLGRDFDSIRDPDNELIRTYKKIFSASRSGQILAALFFLAPWLVRALPIKRNNDFEAASQVIKKTCYSLVQQEKLNLASTNEDSANSTRNILSVAIQSGGFSDEGLVNQLMTFLIAGHETTASALSFAICMLCKHPEIQSRLRKEVRSSLPDPRSPTSSISSDDLDSLPYLNAVCNETLRLYSPVPVTVRVAAQDTTLIGHFIPQGTTIFISPWATNANKDFWGEDAAKFNPDRWLGEGKANTGGIESNYGFLTFLHGPRSCIGQSFAKGEFACLLAAWAGTFETRFASADYVMEVRNGLTPKPKDLEVKVQVLEEW